MKTPSNSTIALLMPLIVAIAARAQPIDLAAPPGLLNVADAANYANAVASAKARQRYQRSAGDVIDGDLETHWSAGDGGPQWLGVDWKYPRQIQRVDLLQTATPRAARYRLLKRIGGTISDRWEVVASGDIAPNQRHIVMVFAPTVLKSIRIELTPRADEGVIEIAELRAYTNATNYVRDLQWRGNWLWLLTGDAKGYNVRDAAKGHRYFRKTFDLTDAAAVTHARLVAAAKHSAVLYINGVKLGQVNTNSSADEISFDLRAHLRTGRNVIAADAYFSGAGGWAGFIAEAAIEADGAAPIDIVTDATWKVSPVEADHWHAAAFDDHAWDAAQVQCVAYDAPSYQTWKQIGDLPYTPPGREQVAVLTKMKMPDRLAPGQLIDMVTHFRATQPPTGDFGFILKGGWPSLCPGDDYRLLEATAQPDIPTRRWQPGKTYRATFKVWVPEYAPPGATIDLQLYGTDGRSRLRLDSTSPMTATIQGAPPPPVRQRGNIDVKHNGQLPVIHHDGQVLTGTHAMVANAKSFENLYNLAAMDYPIFVVGSYPQYLIDARENEQANLDLCFRIIDRQIRVLRAHRPEARFIVGMMYRATPAFIAAHEDQCVKLLDDRTLRPSPASPQFVDGCVRATAAMLDRFDRQPYAGRIIGYDMGGGEDGSFRWWGYNRGRLGTREDALVPVDVCPPTLDAFRAYLKDRYKTDGALSKAWNSATATLAEAMPDDAALRRSYGGALLDPLRARAGIDYIDFRLRLMQNLRSRLAGMIHEHYRGQVLLQTHSSIVEYPIFGPTPQLIGNGIQHELVTGGKYTAVGQNHSYNFRRRNEHYVAPVAAGSNRLHGVITFSELDNRTFLSSLADYKEFSLAGTLDLERLHFGAGLCMGLVERRLSFDSGRRGPNAILWTGDAQIAELLSRQHRLERFATGEPWHGDKQVAVILGRRSPVHMDLRTAAPLFNRLHHVLALELSKLGAGFDLFLLDDIEQHDLQNDYRLYIFLTAEVMTDEQCRTIAQRFRRDGKTLLWFWAPGYVDESRGFAPQRVSEVTGIDLAMDTQDIEPVVEVDRASSMALGFAGASFRNALPYANRNHFERAYSPHFYAVDDRAEVAGRYAHNGKPALVVKQNKDHTTVFCGAPFMPRAILRNVATQAGVHLYVDDPDVYVNANRNWLVLHSLTEKPKACTVRLRRPSRITDAYSGERLAERAAELDVQLAPYQTRLLYLGTRTLP